MSISGTNEATQSTFLGSSAPAQVDAGDTGTAGVSSSAARADHEHPIVAAAPSDIGLTGSNSEGAATSFARSNHIHAYNPPACQVTHNTTQSLADSTETTLAFNSERYDTDSMHSTSVDTSRITIKTAGVYLITFNAQLTAGTDYTMVYAYVRLNGTTAIAQAINGTIADAGSAGPTLVLAKPWKFAANDYIEIRVYQNNGANAARNVLASSTFSPDFAATWIGVG